MNKLKAYIMELRAPYITVTVFPVILGALLARNEGFFSWSLFGWTMAAAILLHLGINVINDYYDHKNGTDENNKEFITPFAGGSRIIPNKLLTPLEVRNEAIVLFVLSGAIGMYLFTQVGIGVLALGLFGLVTGVLYSSLNNNFFIGEAMVGLNFGVLMSVGSYFVQTTSFSWDVVWISLPLGILTSLILWVNEFPDIKADEKAGKKTLVVRMGRKAAAKVYGISMVFTYGYIVFLSQWKSVPWLLLAALTAPLAIIATMKVLKFYDEPKKMFAAYPSTIILHVAIGLVFVLVYSFALP